MKTCPYCAEQIPDKAKKCKFCGEDPTEEVETIDENNELLFLSYNSVFKIQNHLEFIGYECEKIDSNKDTETLFCKHASKNTLVIGCNKNLNIAFFRVRLRLNELAKVKISQKYYETFNTINSESLITKRYSSIEEDIVVINVEGALNGYEKKLFGTFIDLFEAEIAKYSAYFKDHF